MVEYKPESELGKAEFDDGVRAGTIINPQVETLGDDYGHIYNPDRRAHGWRNGEMVWAWVSGSKVKV